MIAAGQEILVKIGKNNGGIKMITPNTRLTTDELSDEGYQVVAVIGYANDFAVYQGHLHWDIDRIAK